MNISRTVRGQFSTYVDRRLLLYNSHTPDLLIQVCAAERHVGFRRSKIFRKFSSIRADRGWQVLDPGLHPVWLTQDLEEIMKGANPEAQVAVSTILVFLFSNIRSG